MITQASISKFYTQKAIVLYFIVLAAVSILFVNKALPLYWMFFGALEIVAFFHFLHKLSYKWSMLLEGVFLKKIFYTSLIIRILYVVFSYFYYAWMTGIPFEFNPGDVLFYDGLGREIQQNGLFNWIGYSLASNFQVSDMGHPAYLGFMYSIFGAYVIIPRLISAILSAWMCVLLYKFAKRNFTELTARYTAIIAMLLPHFIYYTGLHLKETNMIFLLVLFMERTDYIIRCAKVPVKDLIIIVLVGAGLFTFRTALGVSAWFAFFSALLFTKTSGRVKGWDKRMMMIIWFAIAGLVLFSGRIEREVDVLWKARETNQTGNMQWRSERKGGNAFAKYGSAAIFAPAILVIPFPTMVNIETQQNQMYQNGTYLVKNVLVFFSIIALFLIVFKLKTYRYHVQLIVFIFSYLGIIAFSSFAMSERFHLPALPFLMVLAGFGLEKITLKQKKLFVPYLVLIAIVVIGWNIFKLVGRGAI